MKKNPAEPLKIEPEEADRLIDAVNQATLCNTDRNTLVRLIKAYVWLQESLLKTTIGLSRLKRLLFGQKTEKRPPRKGNKGDEDGSNPPSSDSSEASGEEMNLSPEDPTGQKPGESTSGTKGPDSEPKGKPGHGRLGAKDYPGATTIECPHHQLQASDLCPECRRGRLYGMEPNSTLRLIGQPLVQAFHFQQERLRCSACGQIFVAPLPANSGSAKYDISLKVILAVMHFHLGMPFKRIETYQAMMGIPLPDATQWEMVEEVANCAWILFDYLKKVGSNCIRVYQDDTGARILTLIKENQSDPPPERTGIHTTVLYFEGEHDICLYFTGRKHAGENLDDLLDLRDPGLDPIQCMSDGLAANGPKRNPIQSSQCLAHGRRKFIELEEHFPNECRYVIDKIGKVYKNDSHCKKEGFSPEQRLLYHKDHSTEVMKSLNKWMKQQFEEQQVEPNSSLGSAFNYMLKRWDGLTCFLQVVGAPLDNNTAERALKIPQRYRKNSLFYANEHGSYVGDILTSLINTTQLAGGNPVHYLTALMKNRSQVFQRPSEWLPWNYRANLDDPEIPLSSPSPTLNNSTPVLG